MSLIAEIWVFMSTKKKFWLLPIMISVILFTGLILLSEGPVIAPFFYPQH